MKMFIKIKNYTPMKTIILLLTFIFFFSKSHSQIGWYDENEETIPDHFAKYDTISLYLLDTTTNTVFKGHKIVKYTHHFPAITVCGAPVYWTIWWRIVDLYFKPVEGDYTFLVPLK